MTNKTLPVVLVDRQCGFCCSVEQQLSERTSSEKIFFDDLQSIRDHLHEVDRIKSALSKNSVVLIDEEGIHTRFHAVRRILFHCGGSLRLVSRLLSIVPVKFGDAVYRLISKNRKRIPLSGGK